MKLKTIIPFLLLMSLFLSACSSAKTNQTEQGDIREKTVDNNHMPAFLKNADPKIGTVYAAVSDHQDLLQYIPCYCGCVDEAGHKSNLECFIHESNPDGSLTWDSHGSTCGTCLNIAAESITMQENGKTVNEIRTAIDQEYKTGYAKPTATPMPPKGK